VTDDRSDASTSAAEARTSADEASVSATEAGVSATGASTSEESVIASALQLSKDIGSWLVALKDVNLRLDAEHRGRFWTKVASMFAVVVLVGSVGYSIHETNVANSAAATAKTQAHANYLTSCGQSNQVRAADFKLWNEALDLFTSPLETQPEKVAIAGLRAKVDRTFVQVNCNAPTG
jgi:Mrp family chromosome partitioning ATPase